MASIPWITITMLTPLVGALMLMLVPGEHKQAHRHLTVIFMVLTFLFSLPLAVGFDADATGYQLTSRYEDLSWIASLGARYHVGIDGISLWLVMLTTFIGPIVALSGYRYIEERVREYHVALLVLQTAMIGAFVSLDVLLFYVFWELMLIPMYFLVGIWGGANRIYAALKLFLYTMVGSVLMLVAVLYVYLKGGGTSFGMEEMIAAAQALSNTEQKWLFGAFALAFLIKVPLFPFHTWLPDAHVQAPTAGSVILASILLKMGTYGLLRYAMPMFPDGMYFFAPTIAVLSVVGVLYGALIAYVQKDIKKLVAYSSVSHLGLVTLGLFAMTPEAVTGALYQSLAHGITTGGLFLCIGILYERRHTREMDDFGGLTKQIPLFAVMFIIIGFGSAAVPGLVGFVGEFLILAGTTKSYSLNFSSSLMFAGDAGFGPELAAFGFAAVGATGVVLGALYLLWMIRKVMFGPLTNPENKGIKDLSLREFTYLLPIVAMTFFMGVYPQVFLSRMTPSVDAFIAQVEDGARTYRPLVEESRAARRNFDTWQERAPAERWQLQKKAASHDGSHSSLPSGSTGPEAVELVHLDR